jgi:hypothetical protein
MIRLPFGKDHVVDMRLDVLPLVLLEARDVDFGCRSVRCCTRSHCFHPLHVLVRDDAMLPVAVTKMSALSQA